MTSAQYKVSSTRSEVSLRDSRHGAKRAFNRAMRRAGRLEVCEAIDAPIALEFDSDELDAICGIMPDWAL